MRYFSLFLLVLITSVIFLMPAWISWIPKASWSLPIKRITVIAMVTISVVFTVVLMTKLNPSKITIVISDIVSIAYLLIVFAVAYYSWFKLR
jgi:hypothetical protein